MCRLAGRHGRELYQIGTGRPAGNSARVLSLIALSLNKFQFLAVGKQAPVKGITEKSTDGVPALLAVIKGPMVHIHSHEFIGQISAHVARILQRIRQRILTMIEAIADALFDKPTDVANRFARAATAACRECPTVRARVQLTDARSRAG